MFSLQRRWLINEWIEAQQPSPVLIDFVAKWIANVLLVEPDSVASYPTYAPPGAPVMNARIPGTDVWIEYTVTRRPAYERDEVWLGYIAIEERPA